MGRAEVIVLGTVAILVVTFVAFLFVSMNHWIVPLVTIAGFLILMALVPRPRQPEIRGEDAYHLHP